MSGPTRLAPSARAYGYQIGQKSHYAEGDFDQMDRVLYDLKNTPYSRRIVTNTYVFSDPSRCTCIRAPTA